MKRQTAEIQSQASQYQQLVSIICFDVSKFVYSGLTIVLLLLQYEEILVKFKRQRKQLEELSQRSSDQLNTEVSRTLNTIIRALLCVLNVGRIAF